MNDLADSIAKLTSPDIYVIGILALLVIALSKREKLWELGRKRMASAGPERQGDASFLGWVAKTVAATIANLPVTALALALIFVLGLLVDGCADRVVDKVALGRYEDDKLKVSVFCEYQKTETSPLTCSPTLDQDIEAYCATRIAGCQEDDVVGLTDSEAAAVRRRILSAYQAFRDVLWLNEDARNYLLYSQTIINISRAVVFLAIVLLGIAAFEFFRRRYEIQDMARARRAALLLAGVGVASGIAGYTVWLDAERGFNWKVFARFATLHRLGVSSIPAKKDESVDVSDVLESVCAEEPRPPRKVVSSNPVVIDAGSTKSKLYAYQVASAGAAPLVASRELSCDGRREGGLLRERRRRSRPISARCSTARATTARPRYIFSPPPECAP